MRTKQNQTPLTEISISTNAQSLLLFHSMATYALLLLLQDQMANVGGKMLVRPNKRPKTSVNDATTTVVPTLPKNSFGGCKKQKQKQKQKQKKNKSVLDSTDKVMIITDQIFSSSNICNLQAGLCFICKKGDQGILICCTTQGCPLQIHASCLGCIEHDDTAKFYCPPCSYNRANSELQEAEKEVAMAMEKALSAKKSLSLFVNHYGTTTNHDNNNNNNNKHDRGRKTKDSSTGVGENPHKTTISTPCTNGDSGKEKSPARKMNDTLLTRKGNHTKQVGGHQNESIMEDKLDEVAGTNGGDFGVEAALISSETNDATVNAKQAGVRNDTGMIEEHQHTRKGGEPGMHAEAKIGCGTSSPPCIATETLAAHANGNNQDAVLKPKIEKNITSSSSKDNSSPKHFSNPTRPNSRCNPVPWTSAEEEMLKKGVEKLSGKINKNIPWKKILASGSHVFKECRTTLHLREKWRRMNRVCEQSSDDSDD